MRLLIGEQATAAVYRVLVVAPNARGLPDLDHLGAGSDLDRLSRLTKLRVVALVGDFGAAELSDELLDLNPDIFHLAAHGDASSFRLARETLSGAHLADLLSQHNVSVALLLGCMSSGYAEALAQRGGVEWVFGATGKLDNDVARLFGGEFYKHLVRHHDPEQAYDYALSRLADDQARAVFVKVGAVSGLPAMRRSVQRLFSRLDEVDGHVGQVLTEMQRIERAQRTQNRELVKAVLALAGAMTNGKDNDAGRADT